MLFRFLDERIEVMGEGTEFLGEKVDAPESQTQVPFPQGIFKNNKNTVHTPILTLNFSGSDTEILDGKVDSKLDVLRGMT